MNNLITDFENLNLLSRKKADSLESQKADIVVFEIYK